jgi:hypothetical protein
VVLLATFYNCEITLFIIIKVSVKSYFWKVDNDI